METNRTFIESRIRLRKAVHCPLMVSTDENSIDDEKRRAKAVSTPLEAPLFHCLKFAVGQTRSSFSRYVGKTILYCVHHVVWPHTTQK